MSTHRVHFYVVVRVPVEVEVPDGTLDEGIIEAAEREVDLHDFFSGSAEYAEEVVSYLIDDLNKDGIVEYEKSRWLHWKDGRFIRGEA